MESAVLEFHYTGMFSISWKLHIEKHDETNMWTLNAVFHLAFLQAAIEEFDENDILDSINECASVNSGDDDDDEIPLEENLTLKHLFS